MKQTDDPKDSLVQMFGWIVPPVTKIYPEKRNIKDRTRQGFGSWHPPVVTPWGRRRNKSPKTTSKKEFEPGDLLIISATGDLEHPRYRSGDINHKRSDDDCLTVEIGHSLEKIQVIKGLLLATWPSYESNVWGWSLSGMTILWTESTIL